MYFNDINEKIIHADSGKTLPGISCSLAGVTYPNPDYRMVRLPSHEYVFEYVISGRGYIETAGEVIEVCGGMIYCFRRGTSLTYYSDPDDPYEKIWMNFSGEMLERLFDFFLLDGVLAVKCTVLDLFLEIHDRLERISSRESREPRDPSDVYADIMVLLFKILTSATKARFFPSMIEMNSLEEKVRAYIDNNVYSDLSLDKISEEFGRSKMHIIRVFKAKFGVTPMQYLIDRKISIAKSLLTGTVMPVKEIAALLRYANTQHFSSSFKNIVGCTPNKYRQTQNK